MLRRIKDLLGFTIRATDGEIGRVHDLYFDDHRWTVRYVVADTRNWLPGRRVLLSPISVHGADWPRGKLNVGLIKKQIQNSPDVDTDQPVARQHETAFHDYYGIPYYWMGADLWGAAPFPAGARLPKAAAPKQDGQVPSEEPKGDPHLRSVRVVIGHSIQAIDEEIGHVEDFLLDDLSWAIRYMVVDTRKWWPGKRILVAPGWIAGVRWLEVKVHVNLTSAKIRNAPSYDPSRPFWPEDEARLLDYYGQPQT